MKKQTTHIHKDGVQKGGKEHAAQPHQNSGERAAQVHQNDKKHAEQPAGHATPQRRYSVACAVLGAVTAAGFAACLIFRNAWEVTVTLLFPLLGAVITALAWCSFARLCLCRDPSRLLLRDFKRALRRALELPVWAVVTFLLHLLPVEMPWPAALFPLMMFLNAVPVSVVLGILSVCSAVRHLRAASTSEPAIYREGPLVLAVLLLVAELAALGWLMFYWWLSLQTTLL